MFITGKFNIFEWFYRSCVTSVYHWNHWNRQVFELRLKSHTWTYHSCQLYQFTYFVINTISSQICFEVFFFLQILFLCSDGNNPTHTVISLSLSCFISHHVPYLLLICLKYRPNKGLDASYLKTQSCPCASKQKLPFGHRPKTHNSHLCANNLMTNPPNSAKNINLLFLKTIFFF